MWAVQPYLKSLYTWETQKGFQYSHSSMWHSMEVGRRAGATETFWTETGLSDGRTHTDKGLQMSISAQVQIQLPFRAEVGVLRNRRGWGEAECYPSTQTLTYPITHTYTPSTRRLTHELETPTPENQTEAELDQNLLSLYTAVHLLCHCRAQRGFWSLKEGVQREEEAGKCMKSRQSTFQHLEP